MKTVQQKYSKRRLTKHEHTANTSGQLSEFLHEFETTENVPVKKREAQYSEEFERLLIDAIDESLSSLGQSAKQAIYYHLDKSFKIKKAEIPLKIEEFTIALEEIFGDGAKLLEIQMMKRLHEKAGNTLRYSPMKDELIFADYMCAHKTT